MQIRRFIRDDYREIIFCCVFSLLPFILIGNYLLATLCFIISFFVSNLIAFFTFKYKLSIETRISAFSFFSSFLLGLQDMKGTKESYDASIKYLVGKMETHPFDELLTMSLCPYDLGKYNCYFMYVLEKEKNNEAHLPSYCSLIKNLEKDISFLSRQKKDILLEKINCQLIVFFFFSVFSLIIILFPAIRNSLTNSFYPIITFILLSLSFPLIEFLSLMKIKGAF